jgi:N-methylhydantoinase B
VDVDNVSLLRFPAATKDQVAVKLGGTQLNVSDLTTYADVQVVDGSTCAQTGMMGGYPGAVNRYRFVKRSNVLDKLKASELVNDIDELEGEPETLGLRQQDFVQNPSDVYAVLWSAAGGFGDPLERDAAKVEADVANRDVSLQTAKAVYGVIVGDGQATAAERARQRLARIGGKPSGRRLTGAVQLKPTENLAVRAGRWCCAKCATDLGPLSANYKAGCTRVDAPIQAANPIVGDPARFIDPRPQFRQFSCPGCGLLVENEIAVESDPVLRDIEVRA